MSELDIARTRLTDGVDALKNVVLDAQDSKIQVVTLDGVVELVALRAFSLLESYLEELFYLSMLAQHACTAIGPVLPVSTRPEVELLIYSDGSRGRENYLTWLPYETSVGRAESYLAAGQPYTWLRHRPVERAALKELTVVRNAVAHPSAYAATVLSQLSKDKGYQVTRPADYLKSLRAGSWEVLLMLTQISVIGNALAESSEVGADALLQPEAVFQANQKAPAGTFVCSHCGEEKAIATPAKLGSCPQCGVTERCSRCGHARASSTTWTRRIV